eukprot:TRINITY_DN589_c0_g1_i3.p2 TRINITY_DN589_c0_g1~~TRINITY_DN589_c0_g1_i3.p2  ORF type:complete len:124 (-),score=37.12 TRINITY_DN589_c0_g1_i3:843-1214(-)
MIVVLVIIYNQEASNWFPKTSSKSLTSFILLLPSELTLSDSELLLLSLALLLLLLLACLDFEDDDDLLPPLLNLANTRSLLASLSSSPKESGGETDSNPNSGLSRTDRCKKEFKKTSLQQTSS